MARSLLDAADVSTLRGLVGKAPDVAIAAALVDAGVLQFDPDDPMWGDRDRVFVGGRGVAAALRERLTAAGADPDAVLLEVPAGGDALALAFGAAAASRLDGGVWRAWCILDAEACDDGRIWEVAQSVPASGIVELTVLGVGTDSERLWRACGWNVQRARFDDPVWLLGAVDHALAAPPSVVLTTHG